MRWPRIRSSAPPQRLRGRPRRRAVVAVARPAGSWLPACRSVPDDHRLSAGCAGSHLRQSSRWPSTCLRPASLCVQGRLVHGGLWRTCWQCPHASSATQCPFLILMEPDDGLLHCALPMAGHNARLGDGVHIIIRKRAAVPSHITGCSDPGAADTAGLPSSRHGHILQGQWGMPALIEIPVFLDTPDPGLLDIGFHDRTGPCPGHPALA